MAIKTIEVICRPCPKCEFIEKKIREVIKSLEIQYKTKIFFEFKHTENLKAMQRYSLSPAQVPVVLINGNVELAGRIEAASIKTKMESILRGY
ncbi:MAG: thioredoxin family protein [Candidatus Omnitrophota bacterium]|jgi:glutaredoxin